MARRRFRRRGRRYCRFCRDKVDEIRYTEGKDLQYYLTERGKIMPRRITGTCAKHQRQLKTAIKRARAIAILPYVAR